MNRSVYSLVLMDNVIEEIDKLAYSTNTSRSALINGILAEYVSCTTPAKRCEEIFSRMETELLSASALYLIERPSNSMLAVRTQLKYKYRPTMKYTLALYGGHGETLGLFKASLRTQSAELEAAIAAFFSLWTSLEDAYLEEKPFSVIEPGRFTRELKQPKGSDVDTADAAARYISAFDGALKAYFHDGAQAASNAFLTWFNRGEHI